MEPIILTAARGRIPLRLTCVALGEDLSVTLSGGHRGHIGAVALAQPRPGGATTSLLALLGHREDDLARTLAGDLASRLGVTVTLACGIHVDGVTSAELEAILDLARHLVEDLVTRLQRPGTRAPRKS